MSNVVKVTTAVTMHPGESKLLDMEFAALLPSGAALSTTGTDNLATSPTVTITPAISGQPTNAAINGSTVEFRVTAPPKATAPYIITALVNDNQGNTHAIQGPLNVEDAAA